MPEFILKKNSLQDRFLQLRTKIQVYGGGFGNGKTTAGCIKALNLSKDYPGSTGLMARSTYPKLNDTLRKEFQKWCPPSWIKNFPVGQNGSNICTMTNGTQIYFRYIAQQGKTNESSTSNLLSATYDWAVIDQIEDPEITHKDFLDVMGRLRGNTIYRGSNELLPRTGPRWIILLCNPTSNWVYTKLVRPLKIYQSSGVITQDLLIIRDINGDPVLDEGGKIQLLIELVEGSTYELRHIHEADGGDFIQGLESTYQGQQRDRFLLGKWSAYEGLVYSAFDITQHGVHREDVTQYIEELRAQGYAPNWVEAYDYGQASPSCYGLWLVTPQKHVILVDGFYRPEFPLDEQFEAIHAIRDKYIEPDDTVKSFCDPSVFSRKTVNKQTVGITIAQMFREAGIIWKRGNNDIANGIAKCQAYINIRPLTKHPFTLNFPSPRLYYCMDLAWFSDETTGYYWKQNSSGQRVDIPVDKNDHAMDMMKYALSEMPDIGRFIVKPEDRIPSWSVWQEAPDNANSKAHRYG